MSESKILLDCGSSGPFGWSSISRFLVCPQLYFWHDKLVRERGPGSGIGAEEPLVRGSIGHAGLAHLYTRVKCVQEGRSFDEWYSPVEAMVRVAAKAGPMGAAMLPVAAQAVQAYVARYSQDRFRVVGVERFAQIDFHGFPYTARIDLEYEDRAGLIWICDHKFVSKIEGKVYSRYTLSGQMLGLAHIGARAYGDRFGGVLVNFIGIRPSGFLRKVCDPAPWMLMRFPDVIARAHEQIAAYRAKLAEDPSWVIPATPSEHTCWPYNRPCPMFELCRWGSGSAAIAAEEDGDGDRENDNSPVDIFAGAH